MERGRDGVWTTLLPWVRPGDRYGYRVHGPWDPGHGHRFDPGEVLVDPYARAVDGGRGRSVVDGRLRLGATTGHRSVPWADTVVYELHVRGFTRLHPAVPAGAARDVRRARPPGLRRPPRSTSASPRSSCCRCTSSRTEPEILRRGLTNYWGYSTLGFFAPHAGYAASGSRGEQVAEFKEMVRDAARRRARGRARRRLQPHLRGRLRRTDAELARAGQRGVLPAAPRRLVRGRDRLRQLARPAPPPVPGHGHGLAALLGAGDARRRLPLRPRPHARPGQHRLRRGRDLPGGRRAGPGAVPGQAGRRAVGRRPRRLPARALPRAVGRVERPVPRHGAARPGSAGAAGRAGAAARPRLRACPARPTSSQPVAAARWPRSTSSPRTTASRCATWCPTTTSTTRRTARTAGTATTATTAGTAGSRARPTTRPCWRCAAGCRATCWRRCCSRPGCRCSPRATRWGAPSAATTTPTASTTRPPGCPGRTSRGSATSRVDPRAAGAAPGAPGAAARRVLRGPVRPRRRGQGPRVVRAGGRARCRPSTGSTTTSRCSGMYLARPARGRHPAAGAAQHRSGRRSRCGCPAPRGPGATTRCWTPRTSSRWPGRRTTPATSSRSAARTVRVLLAHR